MAVAYVLLERVGNQGDQNKENCTRFQIETRQVISVLYDSGTIGIAYRKCGAGCSVGGTKENDILA
jgi:hypothetical protein